jgi:V8-like Glu-specific endopeptidase
MRILLTSITMSFISCAAEVKMQPASEHSRAADEKHQDQTPSERVFSSFNLINGYEDRKSEYGAVGAFKIFDFAFCTGAVIDRYTILTAAHCFPFTFAGMIAIPEEVTFQIDDQPPMALEMALSHPEWDGYNGDLAIVKLKKRSKAYRGIKLGKANTIEKIGGDDLVVVGYGLDEDNASGVKKYGYMNYLELQDDYLVAVAGSTDQRACFGDSGGPMYAEKSRKKYQVGVVSRPLINDEKGKPLSNLELAQTLSHSDLADLCRSFDKNGFTFVPKFAKWIKRNIKNLHRFARGYFKR